MSLSLLRILLLGTYLAGVVGLALGVAMRLGLSLNNLTPRGAVGFAATCFLCTLATRKVAALLEKSQG